MDGGGSKMDGRTERGQRFLRQLDESILADQPLEAILGLAVTELVRLFDLSLVWIGSYEPDGAIRILAAAGDATPSLEASRALLRWDQGAQADVLQSDRPQWVTLSQGEAAWSGGAKHALLVPMKCGDRVVGSLNLCLCGSQPIDPTTQGDMVDLAGQLSISLQIAQRQQLVRLQSAVLHATEHAVLIADRTGVVQWINPAFTRLTGYQPEEVCGRNPSSLQPLHDPKMWQAVESGQAWRGSATHHRRDGSTYIAEITLTTVKDAAGQITHFVAVAEDVTKQRQQAEQIAFLATHDVLTGLYNRSGLAERLDRAVRQGQHGRPSTLVMIDLDNFKLVNDTVGHQAGDQLLVSVARVLAQVCHHDWVARLGGDEFCILLEGKGLREGLDLCERLRAAVNDHRFTWGDQVFTLTLSAGLALYDGTLSADQVMAQADAALYEAKRMGKNRIAVGSRSLGLSENLATANWIARIKDAIATGRFEIHYQPVTRLETGEPWHVEALVRMREEGGRIIPPGHFIPIAERFGFMPDIDRFVIRDAFRTLAAHPEMQMFINLSGLTLSDTNLEEFVRQMIVDFGVQPAHICFEVTETVALLDMAHVRERMSRIRSLGCRFALDDFGSGFASFAYLRSLPVDYVKLDGSYTRDLSGNTTNRALTKAVIDVAHVLGKEVIAEQVEQHSDAEVLHQLGAEYGQGFLWGRPAPLQVKR